MTAQPPLSAGTLLGGRVSYRQPVTGYRTGIEPVLLAASVPAQSGDRVVEAGTGAGAGLLCLAARVGGISGIGIERDPAMAALAQINFAANGRSGLAVLPQDVTEWRADAACDHALANPPWHCHSGTVSPETGRRTAKVADGGLLARWSMSLARALRHRGTLTLILPAGLLQQGIHALAAAGCPETAVLPLWPRQGEAARLIVLRGVRNGGGPGRLLPGLVLHDANGNYTAEAHNVLRAGAALAF